MLTVHHLGISQSERILWLCEELEVPYRIVHHTRDPVLSPESLKSVPGNATGKSPFIEDSDTNITLSESGAICDYIMIKYGNGKLSLGPDHKNFTDYLQWYHFANGTLQPAMVNAMFVDNTGIAADHPVKQVSDERLRTAFQVIEDRLKGYKWLAGDAFTAADVMTVYCLTTQRYFGPRLSLQLYPSILRYLKDCAARPAYQRAMEKGDPEMKILNEADPPAMGMSQAGGTKSDHWKKSK